METVVIKREDLISRNSDNKFLQQVIRKIEKDYWDDGKVLFDVHLDGILIDESSPFNNLDIQSNDYSEIKLRVQLLDDLVWSTVDSTLEYVKKLSTFCESTVDKYRKEKYEAALRDLVQIVDSAQWTFESVTLINTQLTKKCPTAYQSQFALWMNTELKFVNVLKELIESFDSSDYILQADILEFDFLTILDESLVYLESIKNTRV
ncbi:MAG: hypothetical protein HOO06_09315 [Bdellovibrionaceae bacterium]|jgi:hypothetical protein|nr:hypothetical protein [Pseudobdellovibrionaceae bacterium]